VSRCLVFYFSLKMRCVSFYFERSCPEQRTRAALKPQEPHSSGPWTPGAPAEVLTSRRVMGPWQATGVIFVVGKVVLTLCPPLGPLSHNVNPRDGAQDIYAIKYGALLCLLQCGGCGRYLTCDGL
jgi:hypothetical protein